jgi:tetratricopeptide (TPR) repeat protein
MKILLLGVGNAPVRFNTVSTFFENYIGHISSHIEVMTFGYNDGVDIQIRVDDDFQKVIAKLPPHWNPDVCILQGADYNLLPMGIENAPFPTVALPYPGDWDLDLIYTRAIVEATDLAIGAGFFDKESLPSIGAENVEIYYLGSVMDEYIALNPKKIKDRKYDIFFTATWFNDITHPGRSQWAIRLVKLMERYKVCIETPKSYKSYLSCLGESRLAFSHVRRGALSGRVLEAAAQGTIPLVTGEDVKMYFQEGSEFISVTEDNFIEKVEYYLENQDVLQGMSDRARSNISQNFRSKERFLRFLDVIQRNLAAKRSRRRFTNDGSDEFYFRHGEIYFYAYFRTMAGGYFFTDKGTETVLRLSITHFKKALQIRSTARAQTSLAVALSAWHFLQYRGEEGAEQAPEVIALLNEIIVRYPSYVLGYFNMGIFYLRFGYYDLALDAFQQAVRLLASNEGEVDPWCLQNRDYEPYNQLLQRLLNEQLLSLAKGEDPQMDGLKGLYRFAILYFISLVYEEQGRLYEALETLEEAYQLQPGHGLCAKRLACLLILLGQPKKGLALYKEAARLMPMDIDLGMERIGFLYLYQEDRELLNEVNGLLKICKSMKARGGKLAGLWSMMDHFVRLDPTPIYRHDTSRERLLLEMLETLYLCLEKNPWDTRLMARTVEIWRGLGRVNKMIEVVEDYTKYAVRSGKNMKQVSGTIKDMMREIPKACEGQKMARNHRLNQLKASLCPKA